MKMLFTLHLWARKIHRNLVVVMIIFSVIMGGTGMIMKFPQVSLVLPFLDPVMARILHSFISTWFSFVLLGMVLTGLLMYLYPWLVKQLRSEEVAS